MWKLASSQKLLFLLTPITVTISKNLSIPIKISWVIRITSGGSFKVQAHVISKLCAKFRKIPLGIQPQAMQCHFLTACLNFSSRPHPTSNVFRPQHQESFQQYIQATANKNQWAQWQATLYRQKEGGRERMTDIQPTLHIDISCNCYYYNDSWSLSVVKGSF